MASRLVRFFAAICLFLFDFIAVSPAGAHGYKNGTIEVRHPWMMATRDSSAVVSMKLKNMSRQADTLISASIFGEGSATLVDGDRPAPIAIAIPAGETVELFSASAHIRIDGLRAPLAAYDRLSMILMFKMSGPLKIEVVIEERPSH
jgi:periplasmic copper chaperone A